MPFTIRLEPSGRTFEVGPDDVILDAGLAAGIRMPHGCRAGTCKTCRARVVSGTVDLGRAFPAPAFLIKLRQVNGMSLLCRATAASDLVIEVNELPDLPQVRTWAAQVIGHERPSTDVIILRLRLNEADDFIFRPGQYVDFLLPGGVRRSYSIANACSPQKKTELEFHIRHMRGGAFTDVLFDNVDAIKDLSIEAPLGTFFLRNTKRPVVFIASGTGFAPVRSMLLSMNAEDRSRAHALYWGTRTLEEMYRYDEAVSLAATFPHLRFIPVLSDSAPDHWQGGHGLVHEMVMQDMPDLSPYDVYASGAPGMVDAARRDFAAKCGLVPNNFFADAFVSAANQPNTSAS